MKRTCLALYMCAYIVQSIVWPKNKHSKSYVHGDGE